MFDRMTCLFVLFSFLVSPSLNATEYIEVTIEEVGVDVNFFPNEYPDDTHALFIRYAVTAHNSDIDYTNKNVHDLCSDTNYLTNTKFDDAKIRSLMPILLTARVTKSPVIIAFSQYPGDLGLIQKNCRIDGVTLGSGS